MSGDTGAEKLYSAVEESARLVGATFARDDVRPILAAYEGTFDGGGIIFSAQIGGNGLGELEYTVQVSGIDDPYAHALAHGFLEKTDHPVGTLLSEVKERIRVDEYFIDCGVTGGFKKVYANFPRGLRSVSEIARIPSAPPALTGNADLFARYGLDEAALIGIDYRRKTMNVYFQLPPERAGHLRRTTILSMLRDIGLPQPDERMLRFACTAYRIYATFSWDSPTIQRISFAPLPCRGLDLSALPARLEPQIERFMRNAPLTYTGGRISASAVKWSPLGEFLDLGSYYQISPLQLKIFTAAAERA